MLRKNSTFIATRKKINFAGKFRRKINLIVSGKEKKSLIYNSKAESGFCSSC